MNRCKKLEELLKILDMKDSEKRPEKIELFLIRDLKK